MRLSSRLFAALTVVLAVYAVPIGSGVAAAASQPSYSLEERATAIARPALVFLETKTTGLMHDRARGQLVTPEPVVVYNRCSGFVINGDGHVLTSTGCIQPHPAALRTIAIQVIAEQLVASGKLPADQKESLIADLTKNGEYLGEKEGAQPVTQVMAQLNSVQGGQASIPVQVVATRDIEKDRNIALVKLSAVNLPAVQIGKSEFSVGTAVQIVGYRGSDLGGGQSQYVPANRSSKVSRVPNGNTAAQIELDSELGPNSHGGMAIDLSGKVVGLVNIDQLSKTEPRRVVVGDTALNELLATANVTNTLSRSDQVYREALDAYFGGRYTEAIGKLESVLAAVPDHELAANLRQQAIDRRAVEGDRKGEGVSLPLAIAVGVGSAFAVLMISLLVIAFRRRRRQKVTAQQQQYIDMYAPTSSFPSSGGGGAYFGDLPTGAYQQLPAPISIPPADQDTAPDYDHGQPDNPWAPPPQPKQF